MPIPGTSWLHNHIPDHAMSSGELLPPLERRPDCSPWASCMEDTTIQPKVGAKSGNSENSKAQFASYQRKSPSLVLFSYHFYLHPCRFSRGSLSSPWKYFWMKETTNSSSSLIQEQAAAVYSKMSSHNSNNSTTNNNGATVSAIGTKPTLIN